MIGSGAQLVVALALASPPGDGAVCAGVLAALEAGAETDAAIEMLTSSPDLGWPDIKCLKTAGVSEDVLSPARSHLRESLVEKTPLCATALDAVGTGADDAGVSALLLSSPEVSWDDLSCLNKFGVSDAALDPARDKLRAAQPESDTPLLDLLVTAASDNIANANNDPIEFYVLILDPRKVAVAEKGEAMVAVGDLIAAFGADSVESQVYDEILLQAKAAFAEDNVPAAISHGRYDVKATTGFHGYSSAGARTARVPAGSYQLMKIVVSDPIAVAKAQEGAGKVTAGMAVGMDINAKVRQEVELSVWTTLNEADVDSYILR